MKGECKAGLRRHAGQQWGDQFRTILNHGTEENVENPGVYERTIGDLLDPYRTGSAMHVVNAVSREMGVDAASWRVDRLLSMVAGLEREAARRSEGQ